MRITFLGSSHGLPEPNRQCTCTMLELGDKVYFVDMGMMATNALVTRGIPIEAVKAVFITHPHGDHSNGLVQFVDLISWGYLSADPLIHVPKIEMQAVLQEWLRVIGTESRPIRFAEVRPGLLYDDGDLRVTAYATQHSPKSYAFLIEAEGKSILFTGDLRRPGVDFPEVVYERPLDLVVCEAAHFPVTEYEPVFRQSRIGRICVHHHVPFNLPHIQTLAEAMKPVPVTTVYDGLEIHL